MTRAPPPLPPNKQGGQSVLANGGAKKAEQHPENIMSRHKPIPACLLDGRGKRNKHVVFLSLWWYTAVT